LKAGLSRLAFQRLHNRADPRKARRSHRGDLARDDRIGFMSHPQDLV